MNRAVPHPIDQPHTDPPGTVLEARAISKRFGPVIALDDVSMDLRVGEVHALVGENGAGKSTLIKVMTGVHQPDAGELLFGGETVRFARPRDAQAAGVSTIYQEINLVPQLSVARNLFLGREPTNRLGLVDFRRMRMGAREMMERYGVRVDVRRPLAELSLGAQQTVAIARAVAEQHRVLVMDEPTSSLEPSEVERLFAAIRMLQAEGVAIIYVSHRLDEIFRMCDRVTVLRDGRRVHVGPVSGLSRVSLIGLMLGRDIATTARVTQFADENVSAARDVVLAADDLTRRNLIEHVDVTVHAGEVVGLAGLLGSGRSSTAKAIYGAQPIDSGTIRIGEDQVAAGSVRAAIAAGIALIPEDRKAEGIIPGLSVRDNITLGILPSLARSGFLSGRAQDRIADELIARLRIKASSRDQRVSELSGGNQQKVLLARMLAMTPRLLILDDPTRGIDVGAKAEIQALVSELAGRGLAVILISSDLEEVVEGSEALVILRDGLVVGRLRGDEVDADRVIELIAEAGAQAAAAGPGGTGGIVAVEAAPLEVGSLEAPSVAELGDARPDDGSASVDPEGPP
jgi:ribose transport system ATP-binding protein